MRPAARPAPSPPWGEAGLPVEVRLPNPPPLFVGRAREIRWLRDAVLRAPVTVIAGDGGLGKSALTLFVLHGRFAERVGSTVFISLRGSDPHEPLALAISRALVRADGIESFDWSAVLSASEALGTLAVDLADARARWVVLDDLHHADPGEVRAFLRHVSRYARQSRWIATTRSAPAGDELAGQVLELGGMPPADLQRLARALDPASPAEAIRGAVHRASGSPWRLRQTGAGSSPPPPGDLAASLSGDTLLFLQALGLLSVPIPEPALERVAPRPAEALSVLEHRSLLERTGQGLRLHELTRDRLPRPDETPFWTAWRARAGAELSGSEVASLRAQGVRLLLEAGCLAEAAARLAVVGQGLIDAGFAVSLWKMLESQGDAGSDASADLTLWRLRCAVELGDAEVLAGVREPEGGPLEARFLWARLLATKGDLGRALSLAGEVQAAAARDGDLHLSFRAAILRYLCLGDIGRVPEALAVVEHLHAPDAVTAAERDACVANCLAQVGRHDEVRARLAPAWKALPDLPWPTRGQVGYRLANAHYYLGGLREARAALDRALETPPLGSVRFDLARTLRYLQAAFAVDAGDLGRARRELAALDPYLGASTLLRWFFCVSGATLCLVAGELDEYDRRLAELRAQRVPPRLQCDIDLLALRARVLRREPYRDPCEAVTTDVLAEESHRIARIRHGLRSGALAPADAILGLSGGREHPNLRDAARVVRAEARLLSGDAEGALVEGTAAVAGGRESGFAVREAEARQIVCDALLFLGRDAELHRAALDLSALAARLPSPRFERTAAFYEALAVPGRVDPAVLEALAGADRVAPDVAFRARSLLGVEAPSDLLDRAVLAAFSARAGWRAPGLVGAAAAPPGPRWSAGWGIDAVRVAVWLPGGQSVDLTRRPAQRRLLECLAARGGVATKEELVLAVWEERDYHPLRHDNRLQAAVHKLRGEIEDDPAAPVHVTTDSGYALGGVVRWAR